MYREFHCKIVRDELPNEEGRWVSYIVKEGEDIPTYDTIIRNGCHIVALREIKPGPSDQPGFMGQVNL
jgi:hypothetical protein